MGSANRTDARDAATIAVAVGVVGVSFGALAPSAGLSPGMAMAMSALVFAGGAQLAVTGILAADGGIVAAVVAGLVLNLRHLSFGLALAPTLARGPSRFAAAHVITDESTAFVLARGSGTGRARRAFWLLGGMKYLSWQVGTAAGLVLGTVVPDPAAFGVDAAFPAAMLAMLLPMLKAADARRVGAGAAVVALATSPFAPAGVPVLAGLAGLALGGRWRRSPGATTPADQHDSALPRATPCRSTPGGRSAAVDQHDLAPGEAEPCRSTPDRSTPPVDQHDLAPGEAKPCRSTPDRSTPPVDQHDCARVGARTCRSTRSWSSMSVDQHGSVPLGATACRSTPGRHGSAPAGTTGGGPARVWRRIRGWMRHGAGGSS